MRLITLSTVAVLLVGLGACNNQTPADTSNDASATSATAPASDAMPVPTTAPEATNEVAANGVVDPATGNTTTDDPRGNPDRRGDGGTTEPK